MLTLTAPRKRTSRKLRVGRVEDGRGSLGPSGHRLVSHPRSSNRTYRSPASGSPTGFTARYTESKLTARGFGAVSNSPSPLDTQQSPAAPVIVGVCRLFANHL